MMSHAAASNGTATAGDKRRDLSLSSEPGSVLVGPGRSPAALQAGRIQVVTVSYYPRSSLCAYCHVINFPGRCRSGPDKFQLVLHHTKVLVTLRLRAS